MTEDEVKSFLDELTENEKNALKALKSIYEDEDFKIEGGGTLVCWGNEHNSPIAIDVLNVKGNYMEWFYADTMKEARKYILDLKTNFLSQGRIFPKTRIRFL